jgi:DeoR family deoxyribose operon repressor
MNYRIAEQEGQMQAEKIRIGKKAASLLEADDIAIIDAGSTTGAFAREIPESLRLTVLCFSVNIFAELQKRKNCRIMMTGGYYHDDTTMFESIEGLQLIGKTRATKSFIGASGVSSSLGVTCTDAYQVESKKAALKSSQKKVLLADSSKFGKVQHAFFADLKDFDIVITDKDIPADYQQVINSLGIQLILV